MRKGAQQWQSAHGQETDRLDFYVIETEDRVQGLIKSIFEEGGTDCDLIMSVLGERGLTVI